MQVSKKLLWRLALAVGMAATVGSGSASADTIYNLNLGNSSLGNSTNITYGSVDVSLVDSTHANITFTAAAGYSFGDGSAIDAQVNASNFTASVTSVNSVLGNNLTATSGNVDGWGTFNLEYNAGNFSPNNLFTSATIAVTNTGGTWSSDANVLTLNSGGGNAGSPVYAAGHVQVNSSGVTGYAASNSGTSSAVVPEPASITLAGLGVLGLGFGGLLRARRRRVVVAA